MVSELELQLRILTDIQFNLHFLVAIIIYINRLTVTYMKNIGYWCIHFSAGVSLMCRSTELILALFTPPSGVAYAKPG